MSDAGFVGISRRNAGPGDGVRAPTWAESAPVAAEPMLVSNEKLSSVPECGAFQDEDERSCRSKLANAQLSRPRAFAWKGRVLMADVSWHISACACECACACGAG